MTVITILKALLYYLNDIPIEFWDFGLGVIIDALSLIGVGIVLPIAVKGVPHLWNTTKKILIEKGASGYDDLSKFIGKKVEEVVKVVDDWCPSLSQNPLEILIFGLNVSACSKILIDSIEYVVSKNTTYANNLKKVLPKPEGILSDANHRLPPGILKESQDGLAKLLKKYRITDINDPKIMEWMNPQINQQTHRNAWNNLIGGRTNLSSDEIEVIWKQVESIEGMNYISRPAEAINIK